MKTDLFTKRTLRNRKKLKKINQDRYRITVSKSLNNISAQIIDDIANKTPTSLLPIFSTAMLCITIMTGGSASAFIYFQF